MRKPQRAVHAAVPVKKCFTPNLPSLRCGTVCLMVNSFRAERGDPGRRCWDQCGLGCLVLTACYWQEPCRRLLLQKLHLTQVAFRLFTVEMPLVPWWNCLAGLWALYLENKSPFSPRFKWQVGIEAEPSKVCFVHQLSECVRLPPLTNGNKTDKSPYVVFDNIFERLMEAC